MAKDIRQVVRQVVRGDYVATPIKNAFNGKTSYWFSKKGYMVAIYMFTVYSYELETNSFESRLSQKGFDIFIPMLEERLKRPFNKEIYEKLKKEEGEKQW